MEEVDIEQYIRDMRELISVGDTESAHGKADDLLCGILTELGYGELVKVYLEVPKWYA